VDKREAYDLDTAQECLVISGAICPPRPSVDQLDCVWVDSSVSAVASGGVAGPDNKGHIGKRLAGLDVNDANVEIEVDTSLVLAQVVANDLAIDTAMFRLAYGVHSKFPYHIKC